MQHALVDWGYGHITKADLWVTIKVTRVFPGKVAGAVVGEVTSMELDWGGIKYDLTTESIVGLLGEKERLTQQVAQLERALHRRNSQ